MYFSRCQYLKTAVSHQSSRLVAWSTYFW